MATAFGRVRFAETGFRPTGQAAKRRLVAPRIDPARKSCPTCKGRGYWQVRRGGERYSCGWCPAPLPENVALVLSKLTPDQWAFLRLGEHTLADQPMTPEQWDAHLVSYYVEGDDEIDLGERVVWPATKHWFASGQADYKGDCGPWHLSFRYNALGLALRESDSRRMAETEGLGAKPEWRGAAEERHSPPNQQFIPPPNTKEGDETPFHDEETAR